MADFSRIPESHRRASGRFSTRLEDGTSVDLEIRNRSRPLRGHEIVDASIAMRMGRRVDPRVEELSIELFVGRAGRMDIEVCPSGQYRYGRHIERSLRDLVETLALKVKPQRTESEDQEDPAPSPFTR